MREIKHEGASEFVFSERFPFSGVFIGQTEFPYTYHTPPLRKFAMLMAKSGLRYRPKVRAEEPGRQADYLMLTNDAGDRATTGPSVTEFLRALKELGVLLD
jgi:hypothetical protein